MSQVESPVRSMADTGSGRPGDAHEDVGDGFDHIELDGGLRAGIRAPCKDRGASVDIAGEVRSSDGGLKWTSMPVLQKPTGIRRPTT